jgi:hypothetical protein
MDYSGLKDINMHIKDMHHLIGHGTGWTKSAGRYQGGISTENNALHNLP